VEEDIARTEDSGVVQLGCSFHPVLEAA
jgi:hypothetical protein